MCAWNQLGEGFSGIKGLTHKIGLAQKHCETGQIDPIIISNNSPQGKSSRKRRSLQDVSTHPGKRNVKNRLVTLTAKTWTSGDVFSGAQVNDICQEEHIECDSSASDEEITVINDNDSKQIKENALVTNDCASKKVSSTHHKKKSWKKLNQSSTNAKQQQLDTYQIDNISDTNDLTIHDINCSDSPIENPALREHLVNNRVDKRWTFSSFHDHPNRSSLSLSQLLEKTNTFKTLQSRHNSDQRCNAKPRVVRRLHTELSQNSAGAISDVESDSEQKDTIDACGEEEDVQEQIQISGSNCSMLSNDQEQPVSQVNISSGSSLSSNDPQQKNTIKASEWATALQKQTTPVKQRNAQPDHHEDSTKKKKKYRSGSLADKVFKLQRHIKSSVRFWNHSVKEGTIKDKQENCVTVNLSSVDNLCSLYLCTCLIVSDIDKGKKCNVFFSHETADILSLKTGMSVQIHPPWQQLESESGERTILCTHFACSTKEEHKIPCSTITTSTGPALLQASAVWDCPCSQDSRLPKTSCPAVKQGRLSISTRHQSSDQRTSCKLQPQLSARLHSVHADNMGTHENIAQECTRTLLESKEMLKGSSDCLQPFSATVLRVFMQKSRYQLLFQDPVGTVGLACLYVSAQGAPQNISIGEVGDGDESEHNGHKSAMVDDWTLGQLEGKLCSFSGFTVDYRTTCDQDPNLFNIIKEVWTQGPVLTTQSSTLKVTPGSQEDLYGDISTQAIGGQRSVPSFAYILQPCTDMQGGKVDVRNIHGQNAENDNLSLVDVNQVLNTCGQERITFIAKMVVASIDETLRSCSVSKYIVYLFNENLDEHGNSILHKLEIQGYGQEQSDVQKASTTVCLFRDVVVNKGSLQCDSFTLIIPHEKWDVWGLNTKFCDSNLFSIKILSTTAPKLPQLSWESRVGSIVYVEGDVISVDEDSACIIEQCQFCTSDLIVQDSGPLHCAVCNKDVTESTCVLRMAAFLLCEGIPSHVNLRVEFAQSTIKSLLPCEADDEGYDVEQVINKRVKCQACLVEERPLTTNKRCKQTFALRELSAS